MKSTPLKTQGLLAALLAAALLPSTALAAVQPDPAPAPVTGAEQIVARNVEARGGLASWRRIQNMVWTGHMEAASAEMPAMQFVLEQARPNRTRFEVNAMGQHSLRVFDGSNGWKERPGHGSTPEVEPFSAQELHFAQEEQVIDGPLIDCAAHGSVVSLAGIEDEQGHPAYHLDVLSAAGTHESVWVDANSFLDLRYDRVSYTTSGKPVTVTLRYHDYRDYQGVMLPTLIDIGGSDAAPASRMLVEHVELNADLAPRSFTPPARARRHAAGGPGARRRGAASADALPAWALNPAGRPRGAAATASVEPAGAGPSSIGIASTPMPEGDFPGGQVPPATR